MAFAIRAIVDNADPLRSPSKSHLHRRSSTYLNPRSSCIDPPGEHLHCHQTGLEHDQVVPCSVRPAHRHRGRHSARRSGQDRSEPIRGAIGKVPVNRTKTTTTHSPSIDEIRAGRSGGSAVLAQPENGRLPILLAPIWLPLREANRIHRPRLQ